MMHVNTTSCFLAVKYAAPAMMKTKAGVKEESNGSVILTASVAGLRSGAGQVHCESTSPHISQLCPEILGSFSYHNFITYLPDSASKAA